MSTPGSSNHTLTNSGGSVSGDWSNSPGDNNRYKRNGNDDSSAILYDTSGWLDGSAAGPPTVFRSGPNGTDSVITPPTTATTLYLFNGTTLFATLATGLTAPPSGGGTSTEGVPVAVGSFYNVTSTHFSYKVYHESAFSSSQTYELHSTTLTPTFISDIVVGAAAMSINSRTHTWTIPDVVEIRDSSGIALASLTLTNTEPTKKVFCNFW